MLLRCADIMWLALKALKCLSHSADEAGIQYIRLAMSDSRGNFSVRWLHHYSGTSHRVKKTDGSWVNTLWPWPMWPIRFSWPIWPMTYDPSTHSLLWSHATLISKSLRLLTSTPVRLVAVPSNSGIRKNSQTFTQF